MQQGKVQKRSSEPTNNNQKGREREEKYKRNLQAFFFFTIFFFHSYFYRKIQSVESSSFFILFCYAFCSDELFSFFLISAPSIDRKTKQSKKKEQNKQKNNRHKKRKYAGFFRGQKGRKEVKQGRKYRRIDTEEKKKLRFCTIIIYITILFFSPCLFLRSFFAF